MKHKFSLFCAGLLSVGHFICTAPAHAATTALTERERYLAVSFTYQSAAAEAALKRQHSAQLASQRRQIDDKDAALRTALRQLGGSRALQAGLRAQIAVLQRDVTALKESHTAVLSTRDTQFSHERELYQRATSDIMKTAEGQRALELYLAGGPGSAQAAAEILDKVAATRNAADLRANATAIGNDGLAHGRLTTAFVVRMWEKVVAADPGTHWDWVELTRLLKTMNRLADAELAAGKALETASDERDRAIALDEMGDIAFASNNLTRAQSHREEGLTIRRKLAALAPHSALAQRDVAVSLEKTGDILAARGDLAGAQARYEEWMAIARNLTTLDPGSVQMQRDLAVSLERIGAIRFDRNDLAGAQARYEEGLSIFRSLAKLDPTSIEAQADVAVGLEWIVNILHARNDMAGAQSRSDEALATNRKLASLDPSSAEAQRGLAVSLFKSGDILAGRNDQSGAQARYEEALAIARNLSAIDAIAADTLHMESVLLNRIGLILVSRNDLAGARARYEEALAIARKPAVLDSSSAVPQRDMAVTLAHLADIKARGFTWEMVVDQMAAMRAKGQLAPRDEEWFNGARQRAAAEAAGK